MDIFFALLGGLGLFLYGMDAMSRGIQRMAGPHLKAVLHTLTANRFVGVFSGTVATAIVQSSSVTTVMVVGFVNAGLMALPQAISIILGAHIGTTITAQIIAFRIQNFALPIIAIGAILHLFAKSDKIRDIGEALFGFGALFFGITLMGAAFDPLKENNTFHAYLEMFATYPVLGLLAGMFITIVVQSSSVTTGITIALAISSAITFEQAVPLILGENIGTTVTANIAAIRGSYVAKQAARAHFIINMIGAFLALIFVKPFMQLVLEVSPLHDAARQIANAHTIFNVLTTLLFLPLIGSIARITDYFIFGKSREKEELYYLEETSLQDPGTALDQVKMSLKESCGLAMQNLKLVDASILQSRDASWREMTHAREKIDRYQSRITEYLEKITSRQLSQEHSRLIPKFVRILHEIERIADYESKMGEVATRLSSEGRAFKGVEKKELQILFQKSYEVLKMSHGLLSIPLAEARKTVSQILDKYEVIRSQKDKLRTKNRKRVLSHQTQIALANYHYDIVSSLEEIAK
ncbi:MAG: Na/Pi cotransporter family protein, partial [Patescibacteria group bacterium]